MNFTLNVVLAFITAGTSTYGFAVSVNQLRKGFNYLFYWFAAISWLLAGAGYVFVAFGLLSLLDGFLKIGSFFVLLCTFFLLMSADTLKREQVDPVKLAVFLEVSVLLVISTFLVPNAVTFSPDVFGGESFSGSPYVDLSKVAAGGIVWVYACYCAYLANKRAPVSLKRHSRLFFGGTFLVATGIFTQLSASMSFFFILASAGAVLMTYAYSREPKLLFVLPFTALRLTVLETEGGIPLFSHTWNRQGDLADEDLFSGMLQGVSMILKESLQRGDVQEIRMSNAIIIAYRNPEYPVAFVLVVTRSSRNLRDGLKLFAERFCNQYKTGFAVPNYVEQFSGAEDLVAACFPHVPVYD